MLRWPKILIDEYDHHQNEGKAVRESVFALYHNRKIMVVFQPQLLSRTKEFMDDFARELSKFSQIVLIDIYPGRERPLKGISSKELLDRTINENKTLLKKIDLKDYISKSDAEVIVVMGAGDISVEVEKIKNAILN